MTTSETFSLRTAFDDRMRELGGNRNRLQDNRGRDASRNRDVRAASSMRFGFDLKEALRAGIIGAAMNVFEKGKGKPTKHLY